MKESWKKFWAWALVVGGLNWGLVALFGFDFVAWLGKYSPIAWTTRILYGVVGIAALMYLWHHQKELM